ncbi:hypothetical protein [Chitinophaga sp. Cy-1792]|uniref:hypothetical protein n=1 Tax=Chitinophaga sp. Cy-1792 TaxID=2608339 RepID=UPI0014211D99|nr:hypothetical protein [Chitinophaga sp. Cy-1792]NIG54798.1 hypothetical protein [Chitinophaga sp. Cy-1792]
MKKYVLLLGLVMIAMACNSPVKIDPVNKQAAVPANIPFDRQQFKVINTIVDQRKHSIGVLFGNEAAVCLLKGDSSATEHKKLLLLTWEQKPDEAWFGADIPGAFKSGVLLDTDGANIKCVAYGKDGAVQTISDAEQQAVMQEMMAVRPAIMP